MFKCRHKSKFKFSWLEATKAPTLDENKDTNFGWFLLEIITFISDNLDINSKLGFLISGVVNFLWPLLGLIKGTQWLPKGLFFFFKEEV